MRLRALSLFRKIAINPIYSHADLSLIGCAVTRVIGTRQKIPGIRPRIDLFRHFSYSTG